MDAAATYGNITTVPLYDTIGKEYLVSIIEKTEMQTIACSKDNLRHLLALKQQEKIQNVKTLVCFDSIDSEQLANQLQ